MGVLPRNWSKIRMSRNSTWGWGPRVPPERTANVKSYRRRKRLASEAVESDSECAPHRGAEERMKSHSFP